MPLFEKRIIERVVRVFQIEARDEDQAEELYQAADWRDLEVESWPIDAEEPDGWRVVAKQAEIEASTDGAR